MSSFEEQSLEVIDLHWRGPYRWPSLGSDADDGAFATAVASNGGIYLWTVEHYDGFLIYAAGITRRPLVKRFREHTRAYRRGIYTIFDMPSMKKGIRREIWHGFWYKKRSAEKQNEYDSRCEEIGLAAEEQLSNFRIFVASVDPKPRLLDRIEAAIMNALYAVEGPVSNIPDRGMKLAPRWRSESPILVRNVARVLFHGLPGELHV
jgi:hypothetical protein